MGKSENADAVAFGEYCAEVMQENELDHRWRVNECIDFNDPHPYPGAVCMVYNGGDPDNLDDVHAPENPCTKLPITGPSWLDLWKTAQELISAWTMARDEEECPPGAARFWEVVDIADFIAKGDVLFVCTDSFYRYRREGEEAETDT